MDTLSVQSRHNRMTDCPTTPPRRRRASVFLAAVLALGGAFANTSFAQLPTLHTSGRSIVNADGTADQLMGVNLGGWFIMEKWMCPLDSGSLPDTYSVMRTLDNRFGVAMEQSLIRTYQQSWI